MIGQTIGPYEVVAKLGEGGMGQVYKARDRRLERIVAIKVLPDLTADDPELRQRFDREAKTISSLDHPHICALYDLGHEDGVAFLVMQYCDGETLAARLARSGRPASQPSQVTPATAVESLTSAIASRGPIPFEQALRCAREIAHALDAAHRRGIVHRDLKPANVMLTKSGVKLLDFGLAKIAGESPMSGFGEFATRTTPLTSQGAILGTLQYMSPEQLEGREVDARSDIFAFGAVLYEMLTGRLAFEAQSQAGLIAAILSGDPPELSTLADQKTTLPAPAQRALDRLLKRCLAKDPDDRWHSAADLAAELDWINQERVRSEPAVEATTAALPLAPLRSRGREIVWMSAAIGLAIACAALTWWLWPRAAPLPPTVTFELRPPPGEQFSGGPGILSVSPDGSRVAFVTLSSGRTPGRLWVRPLDSAAATPITGIENPWHPFWSPDGRFIAFIPPTGGRMRRADILGGAPLAIAERATGAGAWNAQGTIIFAPDGLGPLWRVADTGGAAAALTSLDTAAGDLGHAWPLFLDDGRRFIYLARNTDPEKSALVLSSLDRPGERTPLVTVHSAAALSSGYLLYHREGTLMAHPFDQSRGVVTGVPVPVAEDVQRNDASGRAAFAASATGVLAYRAGSAIDFATLTWFDAAGKLQGPVGELASYTASPAISPDGGKIAITRRADGSNDDVWVLDAERGVSSRFTSDVLAEAAPVWLHDGSAIIYRSNRTGVQQLYKRAVGGGAEELLFESPHPKTPRDVSPDGSMLLFEQRTDSRSDVWALPLTGDRKAFPVLATQFIESAARFSPDGKWIAYDSNESGSLEVYVQPFPAGPRTRISPGTGMAPYWTADGKTIVYATQTRVFTAVDVSFVEGQVKAGQPRTLFESPRRGGSPRMFTFDPVRQRFLIPLSPTMELEAPITVITNWTNKLRR